MIASLCYEASKYLHVAFHFTRKAGPLFELLLSPLNKRAMKKKGKPVTKLVSVHGNPKKEQTYIVRMLSYVQFP